MGVLNSIKKLVENGLYYLTEHAIFEAEEDGLNIYDIESSLLNGQIRRTWAKEQKYEVIGTSLIRKLGYYAGLQGLIKYEL